MSQPPHVDAQVESIRRFTFSEDWLAVITGLTIVALALAGVITEGWLPL